jgi:hypothetical protein
LKVLAAIDPLFKEAIVLKRYASTTDLRLAKYEGRSCLTTVRTHYVFLMHKLPPLEDGTTLVLCRSVFDSNLPAVPNSMLGVLDTTGWVIRPLPDGSCQVTYVVQVNFEGIPTAIVNLAAKSIPLVAGALRRYLTGS